MLDMMRARLEELQARWQRLDGERKAHAAKADELREQLVEIRPEVEALANYLSRYAQPEPADVPEEDLPY